MLAAVVTNLLTLGIGSALLVGATFGLAKACAVMGLLWLGTIGLPTTLGVVGVATLWGRVPLLSGMTGFCVVAALAGLALCRASNLTGYLLPWDQLAYWATIICVSMLEYIPVIGSRLQQVVLGGPRIGPATLRSFFAMHTAVFPVLIVMLMAFHFWRVRKAGGLVIPRSPAEAPDDKPVMVPTHPDLLLREAALALATLAGVLILSLLCDAPLGQPANPGLSPNPTKAPWYFAGVQELLMHFNPGFALLIVAALTIAAFCLPYLNYHEAPAGVWFASINGRRTARAAALAAAVIMPTGYPPR